MEMICLKLKIATRKSKLAQVQTETIIDILKGIQDVQCEKVLIDTIGDKRLDVTLDKIGGKGLFVKDIETAMLEGRADAAVHSMKDVPFEMPEGFEIAAMPVREDVRDVFVSMNGLDFYSLPKGAKVGTSSLRRLSQLKKLRPDIEVVPIRGNIQTRIDKIERENLEGIILAAAGLKRLDMEYIITNYFEPLEFIPAVGQGALGVEALTKSPNVELFRSIDNKDVRICVEAERSFMRKLNGGCHVPVGAYATLDGEKMYMVGMFEISGRFIKKDIYGNKEDYIRLGEELAEKIINV
jgi:hydroxymethylbilane synthase